MRKIIAGVIVMLGVRAGVNAALDNFSAEKKESQPIKLKNSAGNISMNLDNSGKSGNIVFGDRVFLFRNDRYAGPAWIINGNPIELVVKDRDRAYFSGNSGDLMCSLQYQVNDKNIVIKAALKNNGTAEVRNIRAGLQLGIDMYMEKYPDWHSRVFPTLLRCEKTHFWSYLMGPDGRIMTVSSPNPVASYKILYKERKHRIYSVRLDLMNIPPLPARHPQNLDALKPGESKEWTVYLQPAENLDKVKPIVSGLTKAPMFEIDRYTVAKGESVKGTVFATESPLEALQIKAPDKTLKSIEFMPDEKGTYTFKFTPGNGNGVYTLLAYSKNGKISEAKVSLRHSWSWYLKKARENAISRPQKGSSHTESWYGLFSGYLAAKHFPNKILDDQIEEKFREIIPLMYDKNMHPTSWANRIQNHAMMAALMADKYQVTGDEKDLEYAAGLADFILSKQSSDGAYRNGKTHYTSVLYIAKAIMEVMAQEKAVAKKSKKWKTRYERHFQSVKKAIDDLVLNLDNIDTEGELTYEDAMISCSCSQIAMFALYYAEPQERQNYVDAAIYLAKGHRCLSQIIIPDSRMNGGSLRFWESQYDILTYPNMMSSPHGWSALDIYGLCYLYRLTGNEEWLRRAYNALGACCQLIDFKTGLLRWAFISDPCINAKIWVEDSANPGKGKYIDKTIGEQYMPMISGWYRAPKNKFVTGYWGDQDGGCCDNDVHEIFKCLEETMLTRAYVVERKNGDIIGYNCGIDNKSGTIIVTPFEDVADSVHFNLKNKHKAIVCFPASTPVTAMPAKGGSLITKRSM